MCVCVCVCARARARTFKTFQHVVFVCSYITRNCLCDTHDMICTDAAGGPVITRLLFLLSIIDYTNSIFLLFPQDVFAERGDKAVLRTFCQEGILRCRLWHANFFHEKNYFLIIFRYEIVFGVLNQKYRLLRKTKKLSHRVIIT